MDGSDEGDDAAYEQELRRSARIKQGALALFVLGVAGGFMWLIWPAADPHAGEPVELSAAERSMVERGMAELEVSFGADGEVAPYQLPGEIRDAIVAVSSGALAGDCAVDLPVPAAASSSSSPNPYVLHTVSPLALETRSTAPLVRGVERHEVILVVDRRTPSRAIGGELRPGRVDGRAYLWSHDERRVVCAGQVAATGSAEVEYRSRSIASDHADAQAALDRDLAWAVARAIPEALVAVEAARPDRRASAP